MLSIFPPLSPSGGLRSRNVGVSLVEILIVVTVLGILMALVIPALGDWLKNSQIRVAAESIQAGLQQARSEAVRRNAAVEFRLTGAGKADWEVRLADTTAANRQLAVQPSMEGMTGVVLSSVPAAATITTFDGMGRRFPSSKKNTDGTDVLTTICVDLSPSVLSAGKTHDLQLDISLMGATRLCDPKVSSSTDTRVCEGYPTPCSVK